MYVARRPFRNMDKMIVAGTIVVPATIKRFKSLLNEGRIIEVGEHTLDAWDEFFTVKYGTSIKEQLKPEPAAAPAEPAAPAAPAEPEVPTKKEATVKVAKVVVAK